MPRLRVLWVVVLAAGCGVDAPAAVGQLRQPIVGGALDSTDHAVVAVKIHAPSQATQNITCSGTVVSPHVVLTAGHCVDPAENGSDATYTINPNDDIYATDAGAVLSVKETHLDPDFVAGGAGAGSHDLGVVITNDAIAIAPLPINRAPLDAALAGTQVRIIGYGLSDPAHYDAAHYGKRREALVTLTDVGSEFLTFGDATTGTCIADSGGPTLLTQGGVENIIALHEAVISASCNGADRDTRLDVFAAAFIDPMIEAADPGFLAPPDAGSPVPDAGSSVDAGSDLPAAPKGCSGAPGAPALLLAAALSRVRPRSVRAVPRAR